ncbi:MAG: GNAT family N-acetyltransferase [Rhodospirillaceae bacterium]|nr:GNAT family N-acetyltransferase [Rhodospirillaceae bacterium]
MASRLELLFLHALPLDGTMWDGQKDLLPGATHAPTLYGFGDTVEDWARGALKLVSGDRVIVVGCSIGGSCALEVAALVPDRIAALVLIGTKAVHRPDPERHASALGILSNEGMDGAWAKLWAPLFSRTAAADVIEGAKGIAMRQSSRDIARGVSAFHNRASRDDVLTEFPRPVVVMTGAEDIAPGPRTSAAQAASAEEGRFHPIPDCGHYLPLEKPESLNAVLRSLIAELTEVTIRHARADEIEALAAIEIDATRSLVEAGIVFPNGIHATPKRLLEAALAEALLFVVTDEEDRLVAFLAAHPHDGGLYIGEVDVMRAWQRRGIGRALMQTAINEARRRGLWGAMLTTERSVPFNAPFYASLGFREVDDAAMPAKLAEVLSGEAAAGAGPDRRVGMVLRF